MKEDIVSQKIRRELSNLPIANESRVMYLLVEIRKVLEHEGVRGTILNFYGDWVVHTKLDRGFAKKIFDLINSDSVEGSHITAFYKIRSELEIFLQKRSLSTELVDQERNWSSFRKKLLDILIDTPIEKVADRKVVGSFRFQRRSGRGIEYCITGRRGIKCLGQVMIEQKS